MVKCLMLLLLLVIMDLADPGFQCRLTRSHLARCQEVRSCSGKVGIITNIGKLLPTNDHNVTGKYIPATTYNLVYVVGYLLRNESTTTTGFFVRHLCNFFVFLWEYKIFILRWHHSFWIPCNWKYGKKLRKNCLKFGISIKYSYK